MYISTLFTHTWRLDTLTALFISILVNFHFWPPYFRQFWYFFSSKRYFVSININKSIYLVFCHLYINFLRPFREIGHANSFIYFNSTWISDILMVKLAKFTFFEVGEPVFGPCMPTNVFSLIFIPPVNLSLVPKVSDKKSEIVTTLM